MRLTKDDDKNTTIFVGKELVFQSASEFVNLVVDNVPTDGRIVIDFSETEKIDSSGIGAFIVISTIVKNARSQIAIVNVCERIKKIMDICHLHKLFDCIHQNSTPPLAENDSCDKEIHVLVVDDVDYMRDMLRYVLESGGLRVATASNGIQALSMCQKAQYDYIITDVHMPLLNGPQFIQQLCTQDAYKYTPITILSSDDDAREKYQEKISNPLVDWCVKCSEPESLVAYINERIRELKQHRGTMSASASHR